MSAPSEALPRVYVFCNGCSPQWHNFLALAEDGTVLAGHVCSDHAYAHGDMGVTADSDWSKKRASYAQHYPDGYEVEYVEVTRKADLLAHAGLAAAAERPGKAKP